MNISVQPFGEFNTVLGLGGDTYILYRKDRPVAIKTDNFAVVSNDIDNLEPVIKIFGVNPNKAVSLPQDEVNELVTAL